MVNYLEKKTSFNPRNNKHNYLLFGVCACFMFLISYGSLIDYILAQSRLTLIGMLIIPFSITVDKGNHSIRFAYWLIACCLFYFFIPVVTIKFIGFWFALMLALELIIGKVNTAAFFIPFIHSSFVTSAVNIIGFPLRVFFTKTAALLMNLFHSDISVAGSVISQNDKSFFVDSACAGIMMISVSFVLFFMVYSQRENKTGSKFSIYQTFLYLLLNIFFILLANFFRILFLIITEVPAQDYLHDTIGIISLILFHTLPLMLFFKTQKGNKTSKHTIDAIVPQLSRYLSATAILLFIAIQFIPKTEPGNVHNLALKDLAYSKAITKSVAELNSPEATIYYKYQHPLMLSNHNPMACWKYSGYKIMNENIISINGYEVCTALLDNGQETLYTSWWYDTENEIASTDWKWRMDNLLQNKKTILINVSSKDEQSLLFYVNQYLGKAWSKS